MDQSRWMENLGDRRNDNIFSLAIPGSHDSMTFGIRDDSEFINKTKEKVSKHLGPIPLDMVISQFSNWFVTQTKDPIGQLNLGVRYFHLRVAKHKSVLFFAHELIACSVEFGLKEIAKFLLTHPREIVILDFVEFYEMANADHANLIIKLKEIFPAKICPPQNDVSLNKMYDNGFQVIVIYRHQLCHLFKKTYWPPEVWPSPQPNTLGKNYMKEFIARIVAGRSSHIGLISPCVLEPTVDIAIDYVFSGTSGKSGLKNSYSKPALKVIIPWILVESPQLNVAVADFIELNDAEFPNAIISLNHK